MEAVTFSAPPCWDLKSNRTITGTGCLHKKKTLQKTFKFTFTLSFLSVGLGRSVDKQKVSRPPEHFLYLAHIILFTGGATYLKGSNSGKIRLLPIFLEWTCQVDVWHKEEWKNPNPIFFLPAEICSNEIGQKSASASHPGGGGGGKGGLD